MNLQDLEALAKGMAPVMAKMVEEGISAATAPLLKRIADLEAIGPVSAQKGDPGERGADGVDGKDAEPVTAEQIAEAVASYLAENPPASGRDGSDGVDGKDGAPGLEGDPGRDGADGAPGVDGRDGMDAPTVGVDEIIQAMVGAEGVYSPIRAAVQDYLKAFPPPAGQDGKDGSDGADGQKGDPGIAGRDGADGEAGPVVVGAIKDHGGELVLTLTDGTVLRTGIFDGRPGDRGLDGKDGVDGLGFEDMDLSFDGERKLIATFARGEISKSIEVGLPVMLDRGVYKAETDYERGDAVTWAGSIWIAQRATSAKPDGSDDWRLSVKRGRDGKDGKDGSQGLPGEKGEPGRDGRSLS